MRYVTEIEDHARGQKPQGEQALSNAERQARYRARHLQPTTARRDPNPPPGRSTQPHSALG